MLPVLDVFGQTYHWSIMQAEYSTDLVFKSEKILGSLYQQLAREAVLSVKAEQIATFLGKKITPATGRRDWLAPEHRIEEPASSTNSDRSLSRSTTSSLASCASRPQPMTFRSSSTTARWEHRTGRTTREVAPLKKSIYSLIDLREILLGCNHRYLEFLSSLDDHSSGQRLLERVTQSKPDGDRSFKGLNFFDSNDQALLRAVQRPEFNIHGLARCDLMRRLLTKRPRDCPASSAACASSA
ncbi:MAG: hypothetical protein IPI02_02230 [Sterolibacteriaceae bacterium]|nr:hypothetical protein [Sterolibacteriaceae bacterium]